MLTASALIGLLLLSLIGSLAFSVPALLWLHLPETDGEPDDHPEPSA